ncbi:hypothetical protein ACLKA6_000006, partial [Drosophila palustris]
NRLSFRAHVDYVVQKASRMQGALSRMLPKIGGPRLEAIAPGKSGCVPLSAKNADLGKGGGEQQGSPEELSAP